MAKVTFDYAGAKVLVTGGSNGLGLAIARAFLDAGAEVVVTGRQARADDYDSDLTGFEYVALQMTDRDRIAEVAAGLGRLDVLVNNAGGVLPGDQYDPAVFEESVAVHLFGAYRMSVACKPLLSASAIEGGGSIIHIASMTSYFAVEAVPGYGAAKGAIVQHTKQLGLAWAKDGIRVNAVAPGVVITNMTAAMAEYPSLSEPYLARTPMGRFGGGDEIAPAVLFLCSPAASYITGQTLPIDGGFSIQG
jgi:3-oxoacyl-[acyl-carrier protein] reductase